MRILCDDIIAVDLQPFFLRVVANVRQYRLGCGLMNWVISADEDTIYRYINNMLDTMFAATPPQASFDLQLDDWTDLEDPFGLCTLRKLFLCLVCVQLVVLRCTSERAECVEGSNHELDFHQRL